MNRWRQEGWKRASWLRTTVQAVDSVLAQSRTVAGGSKNSDRFKFRSVSEAIATALNSKMLRRV